MVDNLTQYLTDNAFARDSSQSRTMPAGWVEKDPRDHMGSIMSPTVIRSQHQKLPPAGVRDPEQANITHAHNLRILSEILNHQMVNSTAERSKHIDYMRT